MIRQRYSADEVAKLEQLAWWDWPIEHIEQAIPLLVKGGVAELSDYAEQHNLASL